MEHFSDRHALKIMFLHFCRPWTMARKCYTYRSFSIMTRLQTKTLINSLKYTSTLKKKKQFKKKWRLHCILHVL